MVSDSQNQTPITFAGDVIAGQRGDYGERFIVAVIAVPQEERKRFSAGEDNIDIKCSGLKDGPAMKSVL